MQDFQHRERLRHLEEGAVCLREDGGDVEAGFLGRAVEGLVQEEAGGAEGEDAPGEGVGGVVEEEVLAG